MACEIDIAARAHRQLRVHAHKIVAAAYSRLTPSEFFETAEPGITGELCRAAKEFMSEIDAPRWVSQYSIHDDPKVNARGLLGDARPRIDIAVERVQRGLRPVFWFEAKRLGQNYPISKYVGEEGLLALLEGHYPLSAPEAGMLGYYHNDDEAYWSEKLESTLGMNPKKFHRLAKDSLAPDVLANGLDTWRTSHAVGKTRISIWHSFLRFW